MALPPPLAPALPTEERQDVRQAPPPLAQAVPGKKDLSSSLHVAAGDRAGLAELHLLPQHMVHGSPGNSSGKEEEGEADGGPRLLQSTPLRLNFSSKYLVHKS